MIRTLTAVALSVAILAVATPAVQDAARTNSEQQVGVQVATIEHTATSLVENEDVPPRSVDGPQRVIELSFPSESYVAAGVEYVTIERVPGESHSVARYRVDGGAEQTVHVDAPIVNAGGNAVELGRIRGEHTFVLTLERGASGDPVVRLKRQ